MARAVAREGETRARIKELLRECYTTRAKGEFIPGKTPIPLIVPAYGWEEVAEALDSLLEGQVTMGVKVREFEARFARYLGVRHALMVNSGSSANLLALSALSNPTLPQPLKPGDEVITPAVTWATTVFPIVQTGALPVLVDVDLETFNLIPEEVERAITPRTRAIMLVHLLGNPCQMDRIMDIARAHNLRVIEDACEAHGGEFRGRKVGSFGDLASFSFFFSHHISTVEGGMVVTNSQELAELARSLRAFGWVRELQGREDVAQRYPHVDPRFLFLHPGYNFRPTEVQGAFGLHQIGRLEGFIAGRRQNAHFWREALKEWGQYLLLHQEREGTRHVWFGYPVTVRPEAPFTRREMVAFLEGKGLHTRPIMAGNMEEQPAMEHLPYRKVGELPNSCYIMRHSFFFGNHHGIGGQERQAIVDYIGEFLSPRRGRR